VLAKLKNYAAAFKQGWRRTLLICLALIALLPLGLFALLRIGGLTPLINLALAHALRPLTPVELRLGSLRSDAYSFIEADDVVVLAPLKGAKVPLMTIASLRLEFDALDALRGRLPKDEALRLARIRGMNIFVLRDVQGRWNTSVLFQPRGAQAKAKHGVPLPLLPAGRVELEDSQMVFNDESRGFHSSITRLQGSLDTRALPLLEFSLAGRTEGVSRDNLSVAGEADLSEHSFDSRLDLGDVELKQYLNYFLPGQGLSFEGGQASLSVRLQADDAKDLRAEGRADLQGGILRIPGVTEPLSELNGRVAFDPQALHFKAISARFLGSVWTADGQLQDLAHPSFDVHLNNPSFGLQALSQQVHGLEPLALSGSAQVDVSMTGPAQHPLIQGSVAAPWLSLVGIELSDAHASVAMEGSQLRVEGLKARVWDGTVDGNLNMGLKKDSRLQADVHMQGVRLEEASIHGQRPLPLSGTAVVDLSVRGLVHDPSLQGRFELHQGFLGTLPLDRVAADIRWSKADWAAKFDLLDGRIAGTIAAVGKPGVFKDSSVRFQGIDLGTLSQGLASAPPSTLFPAGAIKGARWAASHLEVQTDATLTMDGPLKEPVTRVNFKHLKGQLYGLEGSFALADPKQPLAIDGDGSVGLGGGDIQMGVKGQALRLRVSQKGHAWEMQALGRFPLKPAGRPGALELTVDGDMRLLDAFGFFSHSGGRLSFDGDLAGTLDAPQAKGDLKIDDFSTTPRSYLAPISGGILRAQLLGQTIEVPQLHFRAGGQVDASGRLDLSAGLKGLTGAILINTDASGLRLENWDSMGTGDLVMDPISFKIAGQDQPFQLGGHMKLSNAVIVYAGQPKPADGDPAAAAAPVKGRGMTLDLRVALGANVWYEKLHEKSVDLLDPSQWLKGAADSAIETFQRPDMYFRMRPTDQDFVIQGTTPDIQMQGELAINQGRLTVMENDFVISSDRVVPVIDFRGRRADVTASAVARLKYMRDDPLTKRPVQRGVNVTVNIAPMSEEELEKSDLAHSFLNYKMDFSCDPPIITGNDALEQEAILNLVVVGDPLVDLDATNGGGGGGADGAGLFQATQINRLISGEARKQLASLSKRGFKFLGTGFIDVFRLVPRFKYQSASTSNQVASTNATDASNQAKENQLVFSDVTLELGKSLGEKLYASFMWIKFGDASQSSEALAAGQGNLIVRDQGVRTGLEYQITPNRTLEGFYNYSVDDNLDPVAFDPNNLAQAHSGVVRLRNTIPTDTYSAAVSRQRRWDAQNGVR
jgi:hypothetical protein